MKKTKDIYQTICLGICLSIGATSLTTKSQIIKMLLLAQVSIHCEKKMASLMLWMINSLLL